MTRNRLASFVVGLVGAVVVAALFAFNKEAASYNKYIVGNLIGLFWVPVLSIFFVLREDEAKFGFRTGGSAKLWTVTALLFAGLLVLMVPASRWQVFRDYYPFFRRYPEFSAAYAGSPGLQFLLKEPVAAAYAEASYGMYLFCWEFFFRGYLLMGLARSLGWFAVVVQAAAFGLLHGGKPGIEFLASFPAGLILGVLALNAKSFVPGFVLHWAASLTFDLLVLAASGPR